MKLLAYSTIIAILAASNAQAEHRHSALVSPSNSNSNFSVSYDYMYMGMSDNLSGTDEVTNDEIFADGFDMAPEDMSNQTHSVTATYKIGQRASVSASVPYIQKNMSMVDDMGMNDKMKSSGMGDTEVKANFDITGDKSVQAYIGLSLPTGDVDKEDNGARLGYMMQTGTGTYDPSVGIQYTQHTDGWNYGAGANATIRFGENDENYRFGNEYGVSAFVGRQVTPAVAATWRVDAVSRENIKGADAMMMPMMDPTQDGNMYGGDTVSSTFGIAYSAQQGALQGTTIGSEFGVPVYQDLDGPQLANDYHFMVNLQKDL